MPFRIIKGGGVFSNPRPWRQHHNRHGSPKVVYLSQEDAERQAKQHTIDYGKEYCAYVCDLCSEFHIGGIRRYMKIYARDMEDLQLELGQRVAANIKEEALKPYGAIKKRWKTAVRRAMR